jgi:autotransporter translocation and assembly factor TamB
MNPKGKSEMKASRNSQPFAQSAAELQDSPALGFSEVDNSMVDNRLQTLLDLAKDGDEIAAAELDLYFALA